MVGDSCAAGPEDQYYHCTPLLLDWTDVYYTALILHCSPTSTYRTSFIVSSHLSSTLTRPHLAWQAGILLPLEVVVGPVLVVVVDEDVVDGGVGGDTVGGVACGVSCGPASVWHCSLLARLSWYAQQSNLSQFL